MLPNGSGGYGRKLLSLSNPLVNGGQPGTVIPVSTLNSSDLMTMNTLFVCLLCRAPIRKMFICLSVSIYIHHFYHSAIITRIPRVAAGSPRKDPTE